MKPKSVKDIAVAYGVHRNTMRAWLKSGKVKAKQVTPQRWILFDDEPRHDVIKAAKILRQVDESHFPTMMKLVGNKPNVIIMKMLSEQACKQIPNKFFDFIYIDASHAYENIKADCNYWYPKLKHYGIIGGHDYYFFKGCKRAVDEFIQEQGLKLQCHLPDWWTVKC